MKSKKTSKPIVENLDWSYSALIAVPEELSRYKKLTHLRLDHNNLETVPWEVFMSLEDLKRLNLSFNRLSALPEFLEDWKSIDTLDVSFNKIASIPVCHYQFFYRFVRVARLYRGPTFPVPAFDEICPTEALHKKYGRQLPDYVEWEWTYPRAGQGPGYISGLVRVQEEEYYDRRDSPTPRLLLEGNPICTHLPQWHTRRLVLAHRVLGKEIQSSSEDSSKEGRRGYRRGSWSAAQARAAHERPDTKIFKR